MQHPVHVIILASYGEGVIWKGWPHDGREEIVTEREVLSILPIVGDNRLMKLCIRDIYPVLAGRGVGAKFVHRTIIISSAGIAPGVSCRRMIICCRGLSAWDRCRGMNERIACYKEHSKDKHQAKVFPHNCLSSYAVSTNISILIGIERCLILI